MTKNKNAKDRARRDRERNRQRNAAGNRARARPKNQRDRKPQGRGLNVTRLPGMPSMNKAHVPVTDKVQAWSDLLMDPFSADSEGVYPPITNDVVPCPSTKVRNYGTTPIEIADVSGGGPSVGFGMWLYPEGNLGGFDTAGNPLPYGLTGFTATLASIDPASSAARQFGPILSGEDPAALNAAAGVWAYRNTANPIFYTFPPGTALATPVNSLQWDGLSNPFSVPRSNSDVKFKCTAFGIRVTYVGKLTDTEGYVDFYNPYAWTGDTQTPRTLDSLRRDPSHRRIYFGNNRTATFVWHPNCESASYASVYRQAEVDIASVPARLALEVGGVQAGDKFEVEYVGFQEFTGHPAVPTNTPAPVAADVVHLANAIPELRGKMNKGSSEGPTSTLANHVQASKVMEHPALKAAGSSINDVVQKHIKGGKKSIIADIADVALPLLSFL